MLQHLLSKISIFIESERAFQALVTASIISIIFLSARVLKKLIMIRIARSMSIIHSAAFRYGVLKTVKPILVPFISSVVLIMVCVIMQTTGWNYDIILDTIKILTLYILLQIVTQIRKNRNSKFFIIIIVASSIFQRFGLNDLFQQTLSGVELDIVELKISLYSVLRSLLVFIILYWIISTISDGGKALIHQIIGPGERNEHDKELFCKIFNYCLYAVALIIILTIMGVQASHIALVGSGVGIGIGIGMQRIAANFISGIILLAEKSIRIGDFIQIGEDEYKGTVTNLGVRATTILTENGKSLLIPNEILITERAINFTLDNAKMRLMLNFSILSFEKIQHLLDLIKKATTSVSGVSKSMEISAFIKTVDERGMQINVIFWIDDIVHTSMRQVRSEVWKKILDVLMKNDVKMSISYEVTMDYKEIWGERN
jgi:small-conductance mechanosensitive channel